MGEHRSEPLREQRFLPGHVPFGDILDVHFGYLITIC
jgi:hypothetical protein